MRKRLIVADEDRIHGHRMGRNQHIKGAERLAGCLQFRPKIAIDGCLFPSPGENLNFAQKSLDCRVEAVSMRGPGQPISDFRFGDCRDTANLVLL